MEEIDFDNVFKIQIMAMRLTLCSPDIKFDKRWFFKIIIIFGMYTLAFVIVINAMLNDIKNRDHFGVCRNGIPMIVFLTTVMNYFHLLSNIKTIRKLMEIMKSDYRKMPDLDVRCRTVFINTTVKSTLLLKCWFIVVTGSVFSFFLKSVCLSIYYASIGEYRYVSFHETHYPDFMEKRKRINVYVFALTYMIEISFMTLSASLFTCTLPIGPLFMLHACALLEQVKIKFQDIFKEDNVEDRLNDIIRDLQHAYSFIEEINICFKIIYEVMLKESTIILPVISYALVKLIAQGEFVVEYLPVLVGGFLTTMPCYYSDLLISKGEEVRQAAYECGWERVFNRGARKTLLIILMRASIPTAIKSVFRTVNLDTLADVFRQAYTIFNLMCAMWN